MVETAAAHGQGAIDPIVISLIVVFVAITFIPVLLKRTHFPVVVAEILFGILIGRSWLDIVDLDHQVIHFFSSFGLTYLMFLAGLEEDVRKVGQYLSRTVPVTLASLLIPFGSGYFFAPVLGMDPLLCGTIFCTTSLGLVLPLAREIKMRKEFQRVLLASVVLVDMVSMFLLALTFSFIDGSVSESYTYSLLAILTLFLLPWLVGHRRIRRKIEWWVDQKTGFEKQVRVSFALIFTLAAISEVLGFHSIIGAFIAGLLITEILPKAPQLHKQLQGFGYGFFIPLFFIFMGAKVNLPALFTNLKNLELLLLVVAIGLLSKIVGVSGMAWLRGLGLRESLAMGLFHSARLSLIIAAADIASTLGLIDENLFSIFIVLAMVSALTGPFLGKLALGKGARHARDRSAPAPAAAPDQHRPGTYSVKE